MVPDFMRAGLVQEYVLDIAVSVLGGPRERELLQAGESIRLIGLGESCDIVAIR